MPADVTNKSESFSGLTLLFISNSCTVTMLLSMFDSWLFSLWRFRDFELCHLLGPWSTLPPARGRGKKEQGMQTYFLIIFSGNDTIASVFIPWKEWVIWSCIDLMRKGSKDFDTVSCLFPSPSLWPLNICEYPSSYMLNKLITSSTKSTQSYIQ